MPITDRNNESSNLSHTKKQLYFEFTALFNNTRTLKLKAQPTKAFFAAINQVFGGSSQLGLLPNSIRCLNCARRFDYRALGSSRKLGGVGEHLIDGSEKTHLSVEL